MMEDTNLDKDKLINQQEKFIRQLFDDLSEAQTEYLEDGGCVMPLYFEDDVLKDIKSFSEKDNISEEEFISKAISNVLSDIEPMLKFIKYIQDNNVNDKNINQLIDYIYATGEHFKIFKLLSKAGFIPKLGYENNSNSFKDELLISLNNDIDQLRKEKESQAKEIATLKAQLKQQADKPNTMPADDDIVTNAKRLTTIENVIFALVQLSQKDNSSPYSQNKNSLNGEITQILDDLEMPNNYQTTGYWLNIANKKNK